MFDLLKPLFEHYHIDQQSAEKFTYDLKEVVLLNLLAECQPRLDQEADKSIKEALGAGNFDEVLKIIAANSTQVEWEQMFKALGPMIQDYFSVS